ncbi:MAG TPA: hypothetical protein VF628_09850 [Allosphingosinicella sp.]|jgi:hypothetical protein
MTSVAAARTLIQMADLPSAEAFATDAPGGGGMPVFDVAKQQALVVGSDVVSFTRGVEAEFRQAIADSSLFAQLVAMKKVGADADPMAFFDAYFATLLGLGWMVQKRDTAEFSYKGTGFDVHEAVIGVITAFLAPIAGAGAAVLTVLKGLKEMDKSRPFIKLFEKQSRRAKMGRFQFTLIHKDPDHGLSAEIMAFALNADEVVTQVLFFRLKKGQTQLRRSLGSLSIDTEALSDLRPNLAGKVKAFRQSLIAEADLGPIPGEG